jgi:hypothetical protein
VGTLGTLAAVAVAVGTLAAVGTLGTMAAVGTLGALAVAAVRNVYHARQPA